MAAYRNPSKGLSTLERDSTLKCEEPLTQTTVCTVTFDHLRQPLRVDCFVAGNL